MKVSKSCVVSLDSRIQQKMAEVSLEVFEMRNGRTQRGEEKKKKEKNVDEVASS